MAFPTAVKAKADIAFLNFIPISGTWSPRTLPLSGTDSLTTELYFVLDGKLELHSESAGRLTLSAGEYSLVCHSPLNDHRWLNTSPDNVTGFYIDIPFSYLQPLTLSFPGLSFFLDKVQKGMFCKLNETPGTADLEMLLLARNILYCPYSNELKSIYLDLQISTLLTLALNRIGQRSGKRGKGMVLKPQDIEKIQATRDYLFQHMDKPLTLVELAHKMGLNDFKLKKGYKQLYGATLFEDFLHARMQRASQTLKETAYSIVAIAEMVGYGNVSSFSVAFKKYFGHTPGALRKLT